LLGKNPKIGKVAGCFPNGAATGNLGIKWRISLDWGLFYPPILNDCADLLRDMSATEGLLARPATQPARRFDKVVQGMVLNMLLPLACPPIEMGWNRSGHLSERRD